jgi:hypothetical protein
MLPLETKQSGGKILPHSDLRGRGGGVFLEEGSRARKRKRVILLIFRKWEGVVGTGWSWLRIGTGGGRL